AELSEPVLSPDTQSRLVANMDCVTDSTHVSDSKQPEPVSDTSASADPDESTKREIDESGENVFRCEGEVWTVIFARKRIRLRNCLGLRYIAQLLASKRRQIDADVLRSVATGNRHFKPLDGIELLDQQGLEKYRAEYEDLVEELEEAKKFNDSAKQEQ